MYKVFFRVGIPPSFGIAENLKTSTSKRFPPQTLAAFHATKYLYIRSGDHRFIPIWVVVVDQRVIVRSWNDDPDGWYRAFQTHPLGDVKLGTRTVAVRAIALRSKQLNDAADKAYAAKY